MSIYSYKEDIKVSQQFFGIVSGTAIDPTSAQSYHPATGYTSNTNKVFCFKGSGICQ
jgi:hypothetical protein